MSDFEALMRTKDPAAKETPDLEPLRRRVLAATAEPTELPRRSTRRRLLAVAAVMTLVVGGSWTAIDQSASAAAGEVLELAAGQAIDPPASANQYWEVRKQALTLTADGSPAENLWVTSATDVDYHSVSGDQPSWLVRGPRTAVRQLRGTDPLRPDPGGAWTSNLPANQRPGSWQEPTPAWLAALPTEPAALRSRLYADSAGKGSPDDAAFTYAADVLRSGMVPASQRAALFRVVRSIPGVSVTGRQIPTDAGPATAIGRKDTFDTRRDLLFAETTGEFLGEREVTHYGLVPFVGPTVDLATTQSRKVVDQVPVEVQQTAVHQTCRVDNGSVWCD